MAGATSSVGQNDVTLAGVNETHREPEPTLSASRSSNGDATIPVLLPFLTSRKQARLRAEIDNHRRLKINRFVFHAAGAVALEAPHILEAIIQLIGHESHGERFKARVEQIKNRAGDVLEIFTYSPLIEILKGPQAHVIPYWGNHEEGVDEMDVARKAWEVNYVGKTAALLRKAINQMNARRGGKEYANFVPIVQSSGTGKSRAVDQLARYVFTLPFNLPSTGDTLGYPEADSGLLWCLYPFSYSSLDDVPTAIELHLRYRIFFEALFEAVEKEVSNMEQQMSPEALALAFYDWLKQGRSKLYASVINKTHAEYSIIDKQIKAIKASELPLNEIRKSLKILIEQKTTTAVERAESLVNLIKSKSCEQPDIPVGAKPVWLVLYFDKLYALTTARPLSDDGKNFSAYQILCTTLDKFRRLDLFTIFVSTNPSISETPSYSPQPVYSSARVQVSYTPGFQVPFIELPFDKYNGGSILEEDLHTLEDVCDPKHMVRFGRPLFWTRYLCGDDDVRSDIVEFACRKLYPEDMPGTYLPRASYASVAILSVRLGLALDRSRQFSRKVSDCLVERHMHLAFAVTQHHERMSIGSSSEPILAEAAAQLMHHHNMHERAAAFLSGWSKDGWLAGTEYRKLILRLLLTLAHDRAIQLRSSYSCSSFKRIPLWPKSHMFSVDSFSKPVRLPEFLVALLGQTQAKAVLDSKPVNITGGVTLAESELGQARLNFTHWGKAEDDSVITDEAAWIALGRCMAWECSDYQQDVDHITPLSLWNEKLGRYTVSAIFWRANLKHPREPHRTDIDAERMGFFSLHPDPGNRANNRPYLVITTDLSAKAADSQNPQETAGTQSNIATLQNKRVLSGNSTKLPSHPRYAVTISGCSDATYPGVIGPYDDYAYDTLLAADEQFVDHPRQDPEFLQAIADMKPSWGNHGGSVGSFSGICYEDESRLTKSGDTREPTGSESV